LIDHVRFHISFDSLTNEEWGKEYSKHGDGVKDVAFLVDDAAGIYDKAVSRGA